LKALGLVVLLFSGLLSATLVVNLLETRAKRVKTVCQTMRFIKRMVECFSMSARDILVKMPQKLKEDCGYTKETEDGSLLSFAMACHIEDAEAQAIFIEFARSFGKNYRAEQVRECEYYIGRMEEREQQIANRLPSQKKLALALIVCTTLVVLILLL
jgi:hypothetical protein